MGIFPWFSYTILLLSRMIMCTGQVLIACNRFTVFFDPTTHLKVSLQSYIFFVHFADLELLIVCNHWELGSLLPGGTSILHYSIGRPLFYAFIQWSTSNDW
jgi:hypothetical protein